MTDTFQSHGVLCISNHGGIAIEIDERGDGLRYKWFEDEPTEAEIQHSEDGEAYFLMEGNEDTEDNRYYLKDFMRV